MFWTDAGFSGWVTCVCVHLGVWGLNAPAALTEKLFQHALACGWAVDLDSRPILHGGVPTGSFGPSAGLVVFLW